MSCVDWVSSAQLNSKKKKYKYIEKFCTWIFCSWVRIMSCSVKLLAETQQILKFLLPFFTCIYYKEAGLKTSASGPGLVQVQDQPGPPQRIRLVWSRGCSDGGAASSGSAADWIRWGWMRLRSVAASPFVFITQLQLQQEEAQGGRSREGGAGREAELWDTENLRAAQTKLLLGLVSLLTPAQPERRPGAKHFCYVFVE